MPGSFAREPAAPHPDPRRSARPRWVLAALGGVLLGFAAALFLAIGPRQVAAQSPSLQRANTVWFNTPQPLDLPALRGRVVILDFWTLGCINCIHIVPTLKALEHKYAGELVVIGIHSPKFKAEKDPKAVEAAIRRYEVEHPVLHDPDMQIWEAMGVRAWPTLIVLDAQGAIEGRIEGEPRLEALDREIARLIERGRQEGSLKPVAPPARQEARQEGAFLFPGQLKRVPGAVKRWALADGGHHQIALLDDGGRVIRRFGSGRQGQDDGDAATAQFNRPQGLIATEAAIFVADTDNHLIRRIDLGSGQVTTLAGTGQRGAVLRGPAPASRTALASPWDLERQGERILFSNAGTHQLGALDLKEGTVARLAGSGREDLIDGTAADAALAQPSGLALAPDGRTLWFADSESSAIRTLDLSTGTLATRVGQGLFDFGQTDGPVRTALFQHAIGVTVGPDGNVLVPDTYNSQLRLIDVKAGEVRPFAAAFKPADGQPATPLFEPAGVVTDGAERVLLVDTGNHRVLEYGRAAGTYRVWAQ